MPLLQVLQLGSVDYSTSLKLQATLVALRKQGRIADTLLLLEHPPVITLGRNAKAQNIVARPEFLTGQGVEIFEINRGGDVTYHGPGQLVGYPIMDLRAASPKLGAVDFVRRIEEALIRACAEFGIAAGRQPKLTGVWTGGVSHEVEDENEDGNKAEAQSHSHSNSHSRSHSEAPRKIAAIGVHISRGVTSHGFALNVTADLDAFDWIVPCGIRDKKVTSMEQELAGQPLPPGKTLAMESVAQGVTRQFGNVFGTQILWLDSLDALLSASSTPASSPDIENPPQPANQDTPLREPEDLRQVREELGGRDDITFSA